MKGITRSQIVESVRYQDAIKEIDAGKAETPDALVDEDWQDADEESEYDSPQLSGPEHEAFDAVLT